MTYEELMALQLRQIEAERERQVAALLDPLESVRQYVNRLPVTPGRCIALLRGVDMVTEGRPEAVGAFVDYLGGADSVELVPVLAGLGHSPELLREAIRAVVLHAHKALPGLVQKAGGRRQFAAWCRQAQFVLPSYLPDSLVTIARGTHNCLPDEAAAGMHWSIGCPGSDAFDGAAFFAMQSPLPTVIVARVPRSEVVYFVDGVLPYEVMPADVPPDYEVVTDETRIVEGALRFARHCRNLHRGPDSRPFDPVGSSFDARVAALISWSEERGSLFGIVG